MKYNYTKGEYGDPSTHTYIVGDPGDARPAPFERIRTVIQYEPVTGRVEMSSDKMAEIARATRFANIAGFKEDPETYVAMSHSSNQRMRLIDVTPEEFTRLMTTLSTRQQDDPRLPSVIGSGAPAFTAEEAQAIIETHVEQTINPPADVAAALTKNAALKVKKSAPATAAGALGFEITKDKNFQAVDVYPPETLITRTEMDKGKPVERKVHGHKDSLLPLTFIKQARQITGDTDGKTAHTVTTEFAIQTESAAEATQKLAIIAKTALNNGLKLITRRTSDDGKIIRLSYDTDIVTMTKSLKQAGVFIPDPLVAEIEAAHKEVTPDPLRTNIRPSEGGYAANNPTDPDFATDAKNRDGSVTQRG